MMITITVTSGSEVEGMRIEDAIADPLMGHLTDEQKLAVVNDALRAHLALKRAFDENQPLQSAAAFVWQNTPKLD